MRIAIPVANETLCLDIEHGERYVFYDIDPVSSLVVKTSSYTPPAGGTTVLSRWLSEKGATIVIAHRMDVSTQRDLEQSGMTVVVGAALSDPSTAVESYLTDSLQDA